MGKGPQPTDPKATSSATTGTNVSTAIANSFLGNVNQITPDGSLNYKQSGSYTWTDPYTKETYTVPQFTATQTLSPEQLAIKKQQDAASLNLSKLANNQSNFLNTYMAQPFKYDVGAHEKWAGGLYDKMNAPKVADSTEALRSQLANQGIKVGSDAYEKAIGGLQTAQQSARDKFMLDSYQTGMNSALSTRNQPINEITALLSGGQVSQPNFVPTNSGQIAGTDNGAIIANSDNAKMAAWQEKQAGISSFLGGLGGLFALSDENAKEDMEKIAETEDGIGIFKFRYKGDPKTQIGLKAQEVAKKKPKAVARGTDGLLRVNYGEAV